MVAASEPIELAGPPRRYVSRGGDKLEAALGGGAPIVALVKPQFEVGRTRVGKGGIVRDPALHVDAVRTVVTRARELGLRCVGTVPSPIEGAEGNREFFVQLVGMGQ